MAPFIHEVATDVRRATLPLPMPPGHVHVYFLRAEDGWTLVDTGLPLPELAQRWPVLLGELDAPIVRIAITHFHPDHCWAGADLAALTGATVHQGRLDYERCLAVWTGDWPARIEAWFIRHGVPPELAEMRAEGAAAAPLIRFARDPQLLEPGDGLAGWGVLAFPGHADGHIAFLRDGVLVAGDHLLPGITPAVGRYPEGQPDPLGSYLESLAATVDLAPELALPGHGEPILDPARRALELIAHHQRRLEETAAALTEARSAYEVSLQLFTGLNPGDRRFAVAETLAHLERLEAVREAGSEEENGVVRWRP